MRESNKPKGTYIAHRQNQRQAILEAAEDLFIAKGIDATTISEIAKASRLTRATIYQYFSNKQEVAWALFESIIAQWRTDIERNVLPAADTGCDKLEKFLLSALDFAVRETRQAGFLAQFNILYARERFSGRMTETFQQGLGSDGNFLQAIIRDGIADGSLRPDLDPPLAISTVLNFTAAFQLRLGLLGTLVEVEYGMSNWRIFREMIRIFMDGMRVRTARTRVQGENDANTTVR